MRKIERVNKENERRKIETKKRKMEEK